MTAEQRTIALSPGSELLYVPGLLAPGDADALYHALVETIPWDTNIDGAFARPRRTYWIGDFSYAYSGVVHHPAPWTESLDRVRAAVELLAFGTSAGQFRGLLLNHYRSGADSIGFHADSEPEIEPLSPIASISLGAERTFILRPKRKHIAPTTPSLRLALAHGSCLVMCGRTQLDWRHGIPPEPHVEGGRVNLTFRKYTSAPAAAIDR
jgi:alkylated DNA repair dioxygenase AlkB